MKMPEALVAIVAIAFLFGGLSIPSVINSWKAGDITVSCNNLKAAAIAASQPEPKCAK
jgi:hypothetical protein